MKQISKYGLLAVSLLAGNVAVHADTQNRDAESNAEQPKGPNPLFFKVGGEPYVMVSALASNAKTALPILLDALRTARDAERALLRYEAQELDDQSLLAETIQVLKDEQTAKLLALLKMVRPVLEEALANPHAYQGNNPNGPSLLSISDMNEDKQLAGALDTASTIDGAKDLLAQLRALRLVLTANIRKKNIREKLNAIASLEEQRILYSDVKLAPAQGE